MTNIGMVELARGVAYGAHAGQLDKAGKPYILHPKYVADSVYSSEAKVLAWLHDVVEDTAVTLGDLLVAGFPQNVVSQVDALTHRNREPREEYYARVLAWPVATLVKLADVAHNSSPERLAVLPEADQARLVRKYAKSYRILTSGMTLV